MMNTRTIPNRATLTYEYARRSVGTSALLRRDRDRRRVAQWAHEALTMPAKKLRPYVTPQELSALRNEGGCVGRVLNLYRALASDKRALVRTFITSSMRSIDGETAPHGDALTAAIVALRAEEGADAGDCVAQHDFLHNPTPETARALRECLERQHAATENAIDALRQYEREQDGAA